MKVKSVNYIAPQIREICLKLKEPFTVKDVYNQLIDTTQDAPTYREFTHKLSKLDFIEPVGLENNRRTYRMKRTSL